MYEYSIIFFDGECNLCNGFVQFVIKYDNKRLFKFASLQSSFAQETLQIYNLQMDSLSSAFLLDRSKIYSKSGFALNVFKRLGGFWPIMYIFIFIPRVFRDKIYDFVAGNRYKWVGKRENCLIPTNDLKVRFID